MIGEILRFSQPNVSAAMYHTHDNALMGSLVRVFCVPDPSAISVDELLERDPDIECFFPVGAARRQRLVTVVGSRRPEGRWAQFPLFKAEGVRPPGRARGPWWLWDGDREWYYDGEEAVIARYPERESVNDTTLISMIRMTCSR